MDDVIRARKCGRISDEVSQTFSISMSHDSTLTPVGYHHTQSQVLRRSSCLSSGFHSGDYQRLNVSRPVDTWPLQVSLQLEDRHKIYRTNPVSSIMFTYITTRGQE